MSRPRGARKVYYGHYQDSSRRHPLIRLKGKYLEDLGFRVGDAIHVSMEPGRITITKA